MKMGFELNINDHKYRVKCDTAMMTNTAESDTSNKVNLRISVFNEDGEFIKLDKDSYVAEKVSDFIKNCINGQDSCYWNWEGTNRHLKNKEESPMHKGTELKGEIGHVNKELDSVELARIEFEKNLEEDPNNEWLKRLITGLKMAEQSLQRLEAIENTKPSDAKECLKRVWNDIKTQNNFRQDFKDLTIVENYILKAQEQEELLDYITGFIDNDEIVSDNDVYYVSFKNDTPYLDCVEMDKDHYNKLKKIKESQKGE